MNSESAHGYRPCIIIPGIGQSRVIETDENGEKVMPIEIYYRFIGKTENEN